MRDSYDQIKAILKSDNISNEQCYLKLVEEIGELIRETNRLSGSKRKEGLSDKEIEQNIKDELCDSIQNLFAVAIRHEISYDEICSHLLSKNLVWKTIVENKAQ